MKLTILLLLLQAIPFRMECSITAWNIYHERTTLAGYYELIDDGFVVVLWDAPQWVFDDVTYGQQNIYIGYHEGPELRLLLSDLVLTLKPTAPEWRNAMGNLVGFVRYDARQVYKSYVNGRVEIKFLFDRGE